MYLHLASWLIVIVRRYPHSRVSATRRERERERERERDRDRDRDRDREIEHEAQGSLKFCTEPKDVLFDMHNTFMKLMKMHLKAFRK